MTLEQPEDFYRFYSVFKRYVTPVIKAKHLRWYDREFWKPAACTADTSVLELGSGPGEFLLYLRHKGVKRFKGVEMDRDAVAAMAPGLDAHVRIADIWDYIDEAPKNERWDRIVMLDVLEHFSPAEGARLLERLRALLSPDGLILVRVPNMGSPWGPSYQYGDVTHKASYSAGSLHQLGLAAGYDVVAFLPQRRGPPVRRFCEDMLHGFLNRILTVPPAIWTANIIVIYRPREVAPASSFSP
jgi:SAM-dependent methyltransferase